MSATPETKNAVTAAVRDATPEWPYSPDRDTVNDDPWPLAWDAAAFIEQWFTHPEHIDVEEAICHVPLDPWAFGYDITEWHDKKRPEALLRAHLLRIVKGWSGETALVDYLENEAELVDALGFGSDSGNAQATGLASKATLWRVWNQERLSETHKKVLKTIGQVLVNVARENDVPAPDEVFHPDPSVDAGDVEQDGETVRDRTIAKVRDVWEHAKPMVTKNYELPRGENTELHDNAFFEAHAYIGSRAESYAEKGTWNFAADTTRDRVQTGSTHRYHLQKITPDEAREMHRGTTKELVERARRDSELTGSLIASIDITKSNPYRETTELEFDEDGLANKWLLGYKDKDDDPDALPDIYFQWASIQIVGLDIPLVLDAVPVHRGFSRAAIVDELLDTATDIVDLELVLMDKEFDTYGVKRACERNDVYYLNPGVIQQSDRGTCAEFRRKGKLIHVERDRHDRDDGTPTRKRVFAPAMRKDLTNDSVADDDGSNSGDEREPGIREEMIEEFGDVVGEDAETTRSMFTEFLDEVHEDEEARNLRGSDADTRLFIVFKTNHPDIVIPGEDGADWDEKEKAHMVARIIRLYGYRWGIENGFKQIKRFRVRTTSMKYEYRFFNFLFACTLYNVWRLVDILVKLELTNNGEFRHKPIVTADLFLTIASDYIGLDPPD